MFASRQTAPSRNVRRPLVAGVALVALLLALSACGSDSSSSASTNASSTNGGPQQRRGGGFFAQSATVRACLKKQGVALPDRATRRGGPPGATTTNGRPPAGANGRRFGGVRRDPAQFAKLRAALKKCGVQTPSVRPDGGPPNGGTPAVPGTAG